MKRLIIEFIVGIPIIIGMYALLEFLYSSFIVHVPFVFDIRNCAIYFIVWLACVTVSYIVRKNKTTNINR